MRETHTLIRVWNGWIPSIVYTLLCAWILFLIGQLMRPIIADVLFSSDSFVVVVVVGEFLSLSDGRILAFFAAAASTILSVITGRPS